MIDVETIRAERREPTCISMVNTFPTKGADRFRQVVEAMGDRRFLAARCWTLASRSTTPDHEVDFTGLENVEVIGPLEDIRPIYERTRVLLVPSRWQEPFGRVIAEAHFNAIPVIGSPALHDVWGSSIDYVEDADDPRGWVAAIEALDDEARYRVAVARGRRWADEYRLDDETSRLSSLLDAAMAGRSEV